VRQGLNNTSTRPCTPAIPPQLQSTWDNNIAQNWQPGGQNENWHLAAFTAPAVEHGKAIDLGQAEIEDHRVVILGSAQIVAILAVGGEIDRIAGAFEGRAKLPSQVRLVFDDQDTHSLIPLEFALG
jgi:hypothetical protein